MSAGVRVVITGGSGFLGAALARRLLCDGIGLAEAPRETIGSLLLCDRVPPPADLAESASVQSVVGDLLESFDETSRLLADADVVFHLASSVSGETEADIDLGLRANLLGSLAVLQAARRSGRRPVFVYSSSLAVFGTWGAPHGVITDETLPTPTNSYGSQKFMVEQLVADFSRKGYVDGRSARLMTVSVRPGRPNAAASSFLSGIVREPLAGEPANCPVPPETMVAVSSPERTIEGLLVAAETAHWGPPTAITLPGLSISVGEMVAALRRVAGDEVADLVTWQPDPMIERIVGGWPSTFDSARAAGLGLRADPDFDSVIRAYQAP